MVGFFFMPIYSKVLGPESFGQVALLLSLVSAALTLDFGTTTIIGRDAADSEVSQRKGYEQYLSAILLLIIFYSCTYVIYFPLSFVYGWGDFDELTMLSTLLLILSLLIQNVSVSYLNGLKEFKVSGGLLFFSVVLRGVVTLVAIKYISNDIFVFILSQTIVSIVFAMIFVFLPTYLKVGPISSLDIKKIFFGVLPLVKKGFPLLLFGFSAALVMQLDKIVLSKFEGASFLAAYYLAFTFSTTPILAIAGPIKQYYQPFIVSNITKNDANYRKYSLLFCLTIYIMVVLPVLFVYPFLENVLSLWLGRNPLLPDVLTFSKVLLPAFVIGALSYIPSVLMTVAEDYKFQAKFSVISSLLFAISVFFMGVTGYSTYIAWVFCVYYSLVIVLCGIRCLYLSKVQFCIKDILKYIIPAFVPAVVVYWCGVIISHYLFF